MVSLTLMIVTHSLRIYLCVPDDPPVVTYTWEILLLFLRIRELLFNVGKLERDAMIHPAVQLFIGQPLLFL